MSEHGDFLQKWKQYFSDLQNKNARFKEIIPENTVLNNLEEVPPPTYCEVCQVLKKRKTHKPAGSDNITAVIIKPGGIELRRRIHKLVMNICKEETLPTEWLEGIICPTYKKGGRMICSNLLSYLFTPWNRVLLEKLTGSAASQEIPRNFGTRRFITVLRSARHLSLS